MAAIVRRLSFPEEEETIHGVERLEQSIAIEDESACFEVLQEKDLHFLLNEKEAKEKNNAETDISYAPTDLKHSKEHFSKLKFNFIELETKQGFMERIQKSGDKENQCGALAPNDEELMEIEAKMSDEKVHVKDLKSKNAKLKEECHSLAERVAGRYDEYNHMKTDLTSLVEQMRLMKGEFVDATSKQREVAMTMENTPITLDNAEEILERQTVEMQKLSETKQKEEVELSEMEYRIKCLESEINELQESLRNAKEEELELTARNDNGEIEKEGECHSEKAKVVQLDEMNQWYIYTTRIISNLSGVSIRELDDESKPDHMVIDITVALDCGSVPNSKKYVMDVYFKPGTIALQRVTVEPQDVNISDILEQAVASNDIKFLLREVKSRLTNKFRLGEEINELSKQSKYGVLWEKESNIVVVEYSPECHATFKIMFNYPQFPRNFTLLKFKSPKEDLISARERIKPTFSLSEAIETLQD
eukprot:Nk52_evm12s485 gene=Nk52_evmTU12s485